MDDILSDQVAVITGAASGIGRAVATRFVQRGASVVLCDWDPVRLEEVATALPQASVLTCKLDVTEADAMEACISAALDRFKKVTNAIACAGIAETGRLTEMSATKWRRIIEVNLFGTYLLAKNAVPAIIESGGGTFVAIASDAALRGFIDYSAYCASKHAVLGLIRSMALEYGRQGVRSNAVCPSFVDTPMSRRLLEGVSTDQIEKYKRSNPLGRFATAEEVAAVVQHLSSPEQGFVNGMFYAIDGGLTAGPYAA